MFRCLLWAIAAAIRPKVLLIADNLCLRQQLLVLQRREPRPRLEDPDRRFWILACRWFASWRTSLLVVKPETVLRWHRQGWRTYWLRVGACRGSSHHSRHARPLRRARWQRFGLKGAKIGTGRPRVRNAGRPWVFS